MQASLDCLQTRAGRLSAFAAAKLYAAYNLAAFQVGLDGCISKSMVT